ncbi:ABC transporter [Luteipulveratus mongoliensis]|uniref:ABC transporter n=2 Tax=Luteipulveratus mongoliensis TaxID=571913 RepID=A0A0K1JRC3_9MICO|nr:ABC transporter [Luteipulveratus mongoliensis]
MDSAPSLRLRDVSRTYGRGDHEVRALDHVTLDCEAHTWTAVMGPSGSGKSTLLHCAAGLEQVTSGDVWLGHHQVSAASEQQLTQLRRRHIGFVFQSFNLMSALTAEQNVALPLRLAGQRVPHQRVREVLASVGLGQRGRHRPRELSGGQQQRVAIARAIVTRPDILFADEPTGALDTGSARTVLAMLRGLVDAQGQSVVMVTHDPTAAAYADRVVFLADGRVADWMVRPSAAAIAARLTELEG